jgi:hypothetical protein
MLAHKTSGGTDVHVLAHLHNESFEQQCKATPETSPRRVGEFDATVLTLDPREVSVEVALMLEEVQVTPNVLFSIVGFHRSVTARTGKNTTTSKVQVDMEFLGFFVKPNIRHTPRGLEAKSSTEKHRFCRHGDPRAKIA